MKTRISLVLLSIIGLTLLGCGQEKKKKVEIAYVEWACATASSNVCKAVIEENLGYEVELTPVSAAAMWQALASNEQDAITTAWLPETHKDYYEKAKNNVEDLGPNFEGAKLGWVVPSYVDINSIDEINKHADKFNDRVIGIDPGAGLMRLSENAIKEYSLNDFELIEGSGATMTAALDNAIKNKEWIIVTGWIPHWKFARWNLKILQDPKNTFGQSETINTIVRKGLKEEMPEVYKFLDNFHWDAKQIGTVMDWNTAPNANPELTAKKWVKENQDIVKGWLN